MAVPSSDDPRPYHHGDLRAALIELGARHIAREGVETISVRALAKLAGVTHRAAYQHFPDKDALIAAVLVAAYRRLDRRIEAADAEAGSSPPPSERPPFEQLARVGGAFVAFAFDEPNMFLAMTGPRINQSGRHAALETAITGVWRHVARPIARAAAAGELAASSRTLAAAVFWGGLQGVIGQAVVGRLKVSPTERATFFDEAIGRLIDGIRASASRS